MVSRCIWLCKDTNLKANHNLQLNLDLSSSGVYDSAKILIWKQITTQAMFPLLFNRCIWLCKDTNLKANHNSFRYGVCSYLGVYDSAKILIWKQITTEWQKSKSSTWCIWLCKDTNLKANHNSNQKSLVWSAGVYDSAKILIWKQITTVIQTLGVNDTVYMTLQRY